MRLAEREFDVCIIGCGAGGAVLAKELAEGGLSVIALDEGPRYDPFKDFRNDEIYAMRLFDKARLVLKGNDPLKLFMVKAVGGGTVHYTAISTRFHPSDFKVRSLDGVAEDWPISYEDLEPYYDKVEKILGVSGSNTNPFDAPRGPYPLPPHEFNVNSRVVAAGAKKLGLHPVPAPLAIISRPYDGRFACNQCGFCFEGCQMTSKSSTDIVYVPKAEARGAVILPNSKALRLEVNRKGLVESVVYIDSSGAERRQKAKLFAVACNAVNTPRLLLNSTSPLFPDGLANGSGLVGKHFMHNTIAAVFGRFEQKINSYKGLPQGLIIQDFYETDPRRGFARGYTMETFYAGPVALANGFMGNAWGEELMDFMSGYAYMAALFLNGEDLPDERNRVELDPEARDEHGMPLPRVTYSYGENELKLRAHSIQKAKEIMEAAGAVKTYGSPGRGTAHLMGTCRMGLDPKSSVVNSFGQSHEVKNLFICDGSVFVTSSGGNPTLTIQALATRTADYILREKTNLL